MKKLKLYTVDTDYTKYLYDIDNRVMYWERDTYKSERKYIGIVLRINDFEYFAPLSSPKDNDYYYKKGEKLVKKNTIPIIRLVTSEGQLLGKIKLSYMIPVKQEQLTLYDINNEKDHKYKSLVIKEMVCIRKCREEITKNALVLYNQKMNGYDNVSYLDSVLDFKRMEDACRKYSSKNISDTEKQII